MSVSVICKDGFIPIRILIKGPTVAAMTAVNQILILSIDDSKLF